jgi:hypothetical protein
MAFWCLQRVGVLVSVLRCTAAVAGSLGPVTQPKAPGGEVYLKIGADCAAALFVTV